MSTTNVEKLVVLSRFQNGLSLLPLIFYAPLGMLLAVLRSFIFVHTLIVFRLCSKISFVHGVLVRLMFAVCGLVVTTSGSAETDRRRLVLVANHMTSLDPFILNLVMQYILVLESSSCSGDLTQIGNHVIVSGEMSREERVQFVKKNVEDSRCPLLFFPEGGRANSLFGLMKFRALPFQLDAAIQPIGIIARRWFFDVNVSTHSSPWWADLFLSFFVPFTIFHVKYMPLTEQRESETSDEFCERVQGNLAKGLGVCSSQVTPADLKDFLKIKQTGRSAVSTSSAAAQRTDGQASPAQKTEGKAAEQREVMSTDPVLNVMLTQVREVLPHASSYAVLKDLEKTHDTDVTITNILEGRVDPQEKPPSPQPSATERELKATTFKASSFSKSAPERQMSLQERKQAMLDAARQRYKEKHDIP